MKKIFVVLGFELGNYFKSKSYIVSTIIIALICAAAIFIPGFMNKNSDESAMEGMLENFIGDTVGSEEEHLKCAMYDPNQYVNEEAFGEYFGYVDIVKAESVDEIKALVEKEEVNYGFSVESTTKYTYYVFNQSMFDMNQEIFSEYLSNMNIAKYCADNGLNAEEVISAMNPVVEANSVVLGKDSTNNYWYCYALVIIIFMLIILYGTQVASGVANEKSNRSMEILVTTTDTTSLFLGKVFAAVIASAFQVAVIGLITFGGYQFQKDSLGEIGNMLLNIPSNVLVTFGIFGFGGLLLYAFLYGALGALVSKIEDLNKSAGSAQMVITIVYVITLLQLQNIDGALIKVLSYLPISSYSAMFARVAMGTVAPWEIIVSAVILYASVVGMAFVGGKIFRNSTLRYGNPITIKAALKGLKNSSK